MGAGESKPQLAANYYELLQVDEDATAEEIKVSPFFTGNLVHWPLTTHLEVVP